MEQQKRSLPNEPGRRYAASQVIPRNHVPADHTEVKEAVTPVTRPVSSGGKALDGVAKKRTISKARPALPRPHRSMVLKRHIVERADQHRKQVRREHKRHFASMVVAFIVICALAVLSWAFWDFLPVLRSISIPFVGNHHQAATADMMPARQHSNLDESKPSEGEVQTYQAAADAPRVLRIPKLDIEARVRRVGSSLNGEPISPSNIFDVGWFDDSSKPGLPGAVLINGHISGATKHGVFHDLATLQQNDQIQIERGDKTVLTYTVVKVQTYSGDQIDMNTALQSISADKYGLNLVTSSASYEGGISTSGQRVIVFAVQK